MSTFKRCKVVMLPTNEKAKIGKYTVLNKENKLCFWNTDKMGVQNNLTIQNLYILSDEEIKEGDYFLTDIRNRKTDNSGIPIWELKQCLNISNEWIFSTDNDGLGYNPSWSKKIIATTDPLSVNYDLHKDSIWLPQPSQSFIEKFVEEYNKGNVITDVMVEYDCDHNQMPYKVIDILKINPKDNTITIRKVKDSWSKEEVIRACLKMQHDYLKFHRDSYYLPNTREIAEWTDNWIEENL